MAVYTEAQLKAKLIIDPPYELRFCGPFTSQVLTTLKLTNPSDSTILFKIKTTAPKRYCVRPNFGFVLPHETTSVEICLQPFHFDPNEKNKHKFMVQSVVCPPDREDPEKQVVQWHEIPSENFLDSKLKCVFEMPVEEYSAESAAAKSIKAETSSPPQNKNEEKQISNLENAEKYERLANEVRELREENSKLRNENFTLKELALRSLPAGSKSAESVMAEKPIPMFYIAIAIAAVIFAIIFGKFVL